MRKVENDQKDRNDPGETDVSAVDEDHLAAPASAVAAAFCFLDPY
jgi:hypothetical protein